MGILERLQLSVKKGALSLWVDEGSVSELVTELSRKGLNGTRSEWASSIGSGTAKIMGVPLRLHDLRSPGTW